MIKDTLANLLKTLSGAQVASSKTEKLFESVLLGTVPEVWKSISYPSMKSLSSYVADLCQRITFFNQWVAEGHPSAFWFPAFFFPQSFLTSTLQDFARKKNLQVDILHFEISFESTRMT